MKICLLVLCCFSVLTGVAQSRSFTVGAQSVLDRNFSSPGISYLLMDVDGNILAQRWPEGLQTPLAPGSLLKPWLALAYGEQHGNDFPNNYCHGASDHCWFPRGHGEVGLQQAIRDSCNAYFLRLAAETDREHMAQTLARYHLQGPPANASNSALIGLGSDWMESPLALGNAYLQLVHERAQQIPYVLLQGMKSAAEVGTAKALAGMTRSGSAYAKTGTAPCAHHPHSVGDGFTLVMYPAVQPRILLLVRVHGVNGATSAATAGAMLKTLGVAS